MNYLIDTQALIWSLTDTGKIPIPVKNILQNNLIIVSQISLFEITIKQKIGKLPELTATTKDIINRLKADGFNLMQLKNKHLLAYTNIPLIDDHRDPFDRLLLATALAENIPIISADERFPHYAALVHVIWK